MSQGRSTARLRNAEVINDYQQLRERLRSQHSGQRIVCTIGSWDILHEGHIAYLREASEQGDVLVVGVDSDQAYKLYKKESAFYLEAERQAIVAAIRYVDYVTTVRDVDEEGQWGMNLVKVIQPDVFICNDVTYPAGQRKRLEEVLSPGMVRSLPFHDSPSVSSSIRLKRAGRLTPARVASVAIVTVVSFLALRVTVLPMLSGAMAHWGELMKKDIPLLPSLTFAQGVGDLAISLLAAGIASVLARLVFRKRYPPTTKNFLHLQHVRVIFALR